MDIVMLLKIETRLIKKHKSTRFNLLKKCSRETMNIGKTMI